MHPALYYSPLDENKKTVRCNLCPHRCIIAKGTAGVCRVRKNEDGNLYSLTYNEFTSINLDPIEKKPLYHFYPKSQILSVGTVGCNFRCGFCQNWEISQSNFGDIPTQGLSKEHALKLAKGHNSVGIAYTYNEPLINYEWIKDTSKLFNEHGLKNVLVTNGFINPEPWKELLPSIDAANIDIKSFKEEFYKELCSGKLSVVMKNVETMVKLGKHVEITTLLIPGKNDSSEEIKNLSDWIASLSADIPLHFSRYFPQYKFDVPPTEMNTLVDAYKTAKKKLNYVYLGNVRENKYSRTDCPKCGEVLIERFGYSTNVFGIRSGKCAKCGEVIKINGK